MITKKEFLQDLPDPGEGSKCYYPECNGVYPYIDKISVASLTTPRFCNKCGHKEIICRMIWIGTKTD